MDLKSTNVLLAPNTGWMDSGFMKTADFEMGGAAGTGFLEGTRSAAGGERWCKANLDMGD